MLKLSSGTLTVTVSTELNKGLLHACIRDTKTGKHRRMTRCKLIGGYTDVDLIKFTASVLAYGINGDTGKYVGLFNQMGVILPSS